MYPHLSSLLPLPLVLCSAACATAAVQQGKPVHQFPSGTALQSIAQQASTQPPPALEFSAGDAWQLEGAEAAKQAEQQLPVVALGSELATNSGARYSESLGCVAHELARAIAQRGAIPSANVRRFVAGRCGAWTSGPAAASWLLTVPPGVDQEQVEAQIRSTLSTSLPEHLKSAPGLHVGLGTARVGNQLAIVAAIGKPEVDLQNVSRVADAQGRVVIRGRVTQPAAMLRAHINRGAHGVAECDFDPAFAPPSFSLVCELDPKDDHAWIQLLAVPPGRLVGAPVLEWLALRSADAALSYQPPSALTSGAAQTPTEFRATALKLLNEVRSSANMPLLSHAEAQSDVASGVTLPFFGSFAGSGKDADALNTTITLGLMAGWSVHDGMIQSADLTAMLSELRGDAGRWLSNALEMPIGRAVLLDPHASALALGVSMQSQGVAGLAVTYRFAAAEVDSQALSIEVLTRLKKVRDARGLGNTTLISNTPGMDDALQRIRVQHEAPERALDGVLETTANYMRRSISGYAWETHELENIEFPDELLKPGDLFVGAGITQYRPPGAAWAQYAVLFAVVPNASE